jgi:hypothetical protein
MSDVGAGYFMEEPSGVNGTRVDARFVGWMSPMPIGDGICFAPGLLGRFSTYGTGQDYEVLGLRLGIGKQFSKHTSLELVYGDRIVRGSTPFAWDGNQLTKDLTLTAKVPIGLYDITFGPRYDLKGGELYDFQLSVGRKLHCLEPSIIWNNRAREISMGLTLVGM